MKGGGARGLVQVMQVVIGDLTSRLRLSKEVVTLLSIASNHS